MPCVDGRTNPKKWAAAKKKAIARACRKNKRRCSWDARIAQDAGRIYREDGGKYCGTKSKAQRGLSKWTKEKWTTASGAKACTTARCDRYLPAKAWKALSPAQKRATRAKKKAARGKFVPNTRAAKSAGRKARR